MTKKINKQQRELWVAVILDESGSMLNNSEQTINGFNEFLQDRQKEAKKFPTKMWVTTFHSSTKKLIEGIDPKEINPLTDAQYAPLGMTALYDAIGHTVQSLQKKMDKEYGCSCGKQQPDVMVLIMTDGEENSSKEFNHSTIKRLISTKEHSKSWVFKYIGANVDAMANAQALGSSNRGYNTTNINYGKAIRGASKLLTASRVQMVQPNNSPDFTYSDSCYNIESTLPSNITADQLYDLTVNSDGTLT